MEFGDRISEQVESRVAITGKGEILVRRRHVAFKDWWEGTGADEARRRLVESRTEERIFSVEIGEN